MITIEVKATGARRSLIPHWQLPVDEIVRGGSPLTLREFIDGVVRREVTDFRDRQVEQRLLHVLSQREVAEAAARGRVTFGASEVEAQEVDEETAVGVALESFEDGLYFVLIDGRQYQSLDEQVLVGADSRVTFLRLVALAGG